MRAQRWIRVVVDIPVGEDADQDKVAEDVAAIVTSGAGMIRGAACGIEHGVGERVVAIPAGEWTWTRLDGGQLDIGLTLLSTQEDPFGDVWRSDEEWTNE